MPSAVWSFASAGRLLFGPGAIDELGPELAHRGLRRALLITDRWLRAAGVVDQVLASLAPSGLHVEVFEGGEPEPAIGIVEAALAMAAATRPDVILGLGGGSNLDVSKLTAVVHTHGGRLQDYFGFNNVPGPLAPVACIPTTAGTGSEVSHAAVVTDARQRIKLSTLSPHLRPAWAIVDPRLTLTCPARATADSGIDALTHAIEAQTATRTEDLPGVSHQRPYDGAQPFAAMFAEKAIRLVGLHLERCLEQPNNLHARIGMSLAATLAGLAFSHGGVALVHAMEYPVGGAVHVSHGEGNGLLLPHVMRFTAPVRQEEFASIARWLGPPGCEGEDAAATLAIMRVEQLLDRCGLRRRLRDLGVAQDQLPGFAAKAAAIERLMVLTPRRPSEQDILEIYRAAW